jgi:hypothetical protein
MDSMGKENTKTLKWYRVRFHADYEDSRPIKFPPPGPTWESGLDGNGNYSIRIAYFPEDKIHLLKEYWPEATEIDWHRIDDKPIYTDRFPKPEWWDRD